MSGAKSQRAEEFVDIAEEVLIKCLKGSFCLPPLILTRFQPGE